MNNNFNTNWSGFVPSTFSSEKSLSEKKLSRIFKSDYSHVELHRVTHFANLIARSSCTVYLSLSILGFLNLVVAKLHLSDRLFNSAFYKNLFVVLNDGEHYSLWHQILLPDASVFHGMYYTPLKFYFFLFLFASLIFIYADAWVEEMYMESTLFGKYTAKVRGTLVYGFYLFLLSELMVFAGFFWGLYELVAIGQEEVGSVWFTLVVADYVQVFLDPLLGTVTLFLSGYFVNYAFVKNRIRENSAAKFYLLIGIFYGLFFLSIQGSEYANLAESCSLNAAWSIFYLITGFHGFHVFVGLSFLFQVYTQLWSYDLPGDRMVSFFMAVTYWHFVDWVWILVLYRLYDIVNHSFVNMLII
jgi:cytochrome c oxidase subunit 3